MRRFTALGTLLLTLVAPVAAAQTRPIGTTPRHHPIQRAMRSFQLRIRQGVRSGTLTTAETSALRSRMQALRQDAAGLRHAGTPPTPAERQHLRQELRQVNRAIYRAKHNR